MCIEEFEKQIIALLNSRERKDYERACRLIYKKYSTRIFVFVSSFLKNDTDAQDVVQNTWSKVFSNLDKFKFQSSIYTWIYRIAYNECINWTKSKDFDRFVAYDMSYSEGSVSNFNTIDSEKVSLWFDEAVNSLPPKQRAVFLMRYFDEMPYNKISEITGISEGSLKASFHHAAGKIEKYLVEKLNNY